VSDLVCSVLGKVLGSSCWENRVPNLNICEYGPTESVTVALVSVFISLNVCPICGSDASAPKHKVSESKCSEAHVDPFYGALRRPWSSSMHKATTLVDKVLDRFKHFLLELPAVSEAMRERLNDARKFGCILLVERLEVSWPDFLRARSSSMIWIEKTSISIYLSITCDSLSLSLMPIFQAALF
jgi:hypothetical protein